MKKCIKTPIGIVAIECNEKEITSIGFADVFEETEQKSELLDRACTEVLEFILGIRREFTLPYRMCGTDFEQRVLNAICAIPYGETRSYSEIAAKVGSPGAVRAVGAVCAKNKLLLIIPCHRVLKCDGSISGYSGGVERKKKLLKIEKDSEL